MEYPISGFIHSDESIGSHDHSLYITSWDGRPYQGPPLHIHDFRGVTSFDAGHHHRYAGKTEPAPTGAPHTHYYCTETSFDDGHIHIIKGRTGPDIQLPTGGHIHHFEGTTTVDGTPPHVHRYCGKTGL